MSPPRATENSKQIPTDVYRPEIDGLRAIAVLAVVLFHTFPEWCRGGFIGVDVFFVISGFLISRILFLQRGTRRHALLSFYEHRIRRIFPALIVVLVTTAALGWLIMLPDEFAELRREALASCAFVANFLFAQHDNYFDRASASKPLLHLWSLAIEEQFYLFWPAIVLFCSGMRFKVGLFWLVMVVSLLLCFFIGVPHPVTAFFSPWTRIWELGLGATLAWQSSRSSALSGKSLYAHLWPTYADHRIATASSITGLLLIIASAAFITEDQLYPGLLALLPTVGTFLVIAGGSTNAAARVLGARVFLAVGRISYPLYLWHWPILALGKLICGEHPAPSLRIGMIALAFLLAQGSYVLIERPLRHRLKLRTAAALALGVMIIVATSLLLLPPKRDSDPVFFRGTVANLKLLEWFPADPACIAKLGLGPEAVLAGDSMFCSISQGDRPPSVAVIGDSIANSMFPGLAELYASSGRTVINLGGGTCAPFRGLKGTFNWNKSCAATNDKIYNYLLNNPDIRTVIWVMTPWDIRNMRIEGLPDTPTLDERFAAISPLVRHDLDALVKAGKNVAVTFDVPKLGIDPRGCIRELARCNVTAADMATSMEPYVTQWKTLFDALPKACLYSTDHLFRTADGGYTGTRDGKLLYRDDHHLSTLGSTMVAQDFSTSKCFR